MGQENYEGRDGRGLTGGIGVVSTPFNTVPNTATFFSSAFVGLDFSKWGVALDVLFALHRDVVLASGYASGSPLPAGASIPTKTVVDPAVGVMLSLDSDVFKFLGYTF
ncbi:MAG: hypothetical protein ACHREM_19860 [Polyangiales bacterium]